MRNDEDPWPSPDRLEAQGWQLWDGTKTNPAPKERVRIMTRSGRNSHYYSDWFWWGRAHYDPPRGKLWPKDWPLHPANAHFDSGRKQRHNEIIAWRRDPERLKQRTPRQESRDKELVSAYANLP